MSIYDKNKMKNRTWIEQVKALFSMGSELESSSTTKEYVDSKTENLQSKITSDNAGANIIITGSGDSLRISASGEVVESVSWGAITGSINSQGDLINALDNKQDALIVGEGLGITNDEIDVKVDYDTIYIGDDNELCVDVDNIKDALPLSSSSGKGLLSAADWTTFNNKQPSGNYQKRVYYGEGEPSSVVTSPQEYDIYIKIES